MYVVTYEYQDRSERLWTHSLHHENVPGISDRDQACEMTWEEAQHVIEKLHTAGCWENITAIPVQSTYFIGQSIAIPKEYRRPEESEV